MMGELGQLSPLPGGSPRVKGILKTAASKAAKKAQEQSQLLNTLNNDIVFNVLVLGGRGVGKSSFCKALAGEQFTQTTKHSLGVELTTLTLSPYRGHPVYIQLWDVPYDLLISKTSSLQLDLIFSDVHAAIILFDSGMHEGAHADTNSNEDPLESFVAVDNIRGILEERICSVLRSRCRCNEGRSRYDLIDCLCVKHLPMYLLAHKSDIMSTIIAKESPGDLGVICNDLDGPLFRPYPSVQYPERQRPRDLGRCYEPFECPPYICSCVTPSSGSLDPLLLESPALQMPRRVRFNMTEMGPSPSPRSLSLFDAPQDGSGNLNSPNPGFSADSETASRLGSSSSSGITTTSSSERVQSPQKHIYAPAGPSAEDLLLATSLSTPRQEQPYSIPHNLCPPQFPREWYPSTYFSSLSVLSAGGASSSSTSSSLNSTSQAKASLTKYPSAGPSSVQTLGNSTLNYSSSGSVWESECLHPALGLSPDDIDVYARRAGFRLWSPTSVLPVPLLPASAVQAATASFEEFEGDRARSMAVMGAMRESFPCNRAFVHHLYYSHDGDSDSESGFEGQDIALSVQQGVQITQEGDEFWPTESESHPGGPMGPSNGFQSQYVVREGVLSEPAAEDSPRPTAALPSSSTVTLQKADSELSANGGDFDDSEAASFTPSGLATAVKLGFDLKEMAPDKRRQAHSQGLTRRLLAGAHTHSQMQAPRPTSLPTGGVYLELQTEKKSKLSEGQNPLATRAHGTLKEHPRALHSSEDTSNTHKGIHNPHPREPSAILNFLLSTIVDDCLELWGWTLPFPLCPVVRGRAINVGDGVPTRVRKQVSRVYEKSLLPLSQKFGPDEPLPIEPAVAALVKDCPECGGAVLPPLDPEVINILKSWTPAGSRPVRAPLKHIIDSAREDDESPQYHSFVF